MKAWIALLSLGLATTAFIAAEPDATPRTADAQPVRPNILIILADDLRYADLGYRGSPDVKSPQIDSHAVNGVRCTAGYVTAPQCSPSRAGLLSGQYQQRFGHEGNPNFPLMLMRGGKIIPEHLKASGYATEHFGKWHLGFSDLGSAPKEIRDSKDQMLPTALAAAQNPTINGVQLDGVNLFPFLDGQQRTDPHEALFWRWRAEQAIRIGDWKLVRGREQKEWRLMDLVSDVKETNDLTANHPDKAKELLTCFETWNATLPSVGPSFKDTTEGEEPESKTRKQ